jgi:ligand-binding SRPBCC domain-containing protein
MSETYKLRCWTRFLATPEEVWALKTDPARLDAEMMPVLRVHFEDADAPARAMKGEGLPASFQSQIQLGGVIGLLDWPVEITAVEPGRRLVNTSTNDLFSRWEHEHLFEPATDATRYLDSVIFTPRPAHHELIAQLVQRFFVHRHKRAAKCLPTDKRATAVAMLRFMELTPQHA